MLSLVNGLRASGGVCGGQAFGATNPLTLNALLNESALLHAIDMGENDYFDHTSLDGRTPWDRMEAAGYRGTRYGENIAAGTMTAAETYGLWLDSPGHCRNMLSPNFSELGVGYAAVQGSSYRHYWVQNFGRR